jgi:hypothetical protein
VQDVEHVFRFPQGKRMSECDISVLSAADRLIRAHVTFSKISPFPSRKLGVFDSPETRFPHDPGSLRLGSGGSVTTEFVRYLAS